MFERKNILSMVLAFILILSNTVILAQESVAEIQPGLMGEDLSIPIRDASFCALDELVDDDKYALYNADDLYKGNLRDLLNEDLRDSLLISFREKL